jgi:hypothetical protein
MDLNLDILPTDVLIVEEMEELELTKDFLLFNKLVLNVLEVVKKSQIHAMIVMAKAINKLQRN